MSFLARALEDRHRLVTQRDNAIARALRAERQLAAAVETVKNLRAENAGLHRQLDDLYCAGCGAVTTRRLS